MRLAAVLLTVALGGCSAPAEPTSGATQDPTRAPSGRSAWWSTIEHLDDVRSRAYREGRPAMLGQVYLPGSPLLDSDRAMLRAYVRRGIDLTGAPIQLRSVRVMWHRDDRAALRVVDRLRSPSVTVAGQSRQLPRDRPTERVIVLRRASGDWRIVRIRRLAG